MPHVTSCGPRRLYVLHRRRGVHPHSACGVQLSGYGDAGRHASVPCFGVEENATWRGCDWHLRACVAAACGPASSAVRQVWPHSLAAAPVLQQVCLVFAQVLLGVWQVFARVLQLVFVAFAPVLRLVFAAFVQAWHWVFAAFVQALRLADYSHPLRASGCLGWAGLPCLDCRACGRGYQAVHPYPAWSVSIVSHRASASRPWSCDRHCPYGR